MTLRDSSRRANALSKKVLDKPTGDALPYCSVGLFGALPPQRDVERKLVHVLPFAKAFRRRLSRQEKRRA